MQLDIWISEPRLVHLKLNLGFIIMEEKNGSIGVHGQNKEASKYVDVMEIQRRFIVVRGSFIYWWKWGMAENILVKQMNLDGSLLKEIGKM